MSDDDVVPVLLVDDDVEDFVLTAHLAEELRRPRVRLDWVEGFQKGLEAMRSGAHQVLLIDYHLRDGNGLDLLRAASQMKCTAPMILLTGQGDVKLDIEAMNLGAADYLIKDGLQSGELERAIRYALAHAREREKLESANRCLENALEDLRKAQEHLVRKERLHAIGQMAAGIAHDLFNTLSLVLGYSDQLLEQVESWTDRGPAVHRMRLINGAAQDAVQVLHRLREFYRPRNEEDDLDHVQLKTVARRAISLTRPRWKDQPQADGRTIILKTDLPRVPLIWGNSAELTELLTNLIFNAVDAMPRGGTITIRTRPDRRLTCPPNGTAEGPERDGVILEVSDTGVGMSEEVRRQCMQPFFTTKGASGSGMGLSTSVGIVRRHEGELDIESHLTTGTCMRLWFPATARRPPSRPAAESRSGPVAVETLDRPAQPQTRGAALRVLLVDDDEDVRTLVAELLSEEGHTVVTAQDVRQGSDLFDPGQFDLVITDQAMPGATGVELAAEIKRLDPEVPVVLLTGFSDMMSINKACPEGVMAVLSKPVRVRELRQLVSGIARRQPPVVDSGGSPGPRTMTRC